MDNFRKKFDFYRDDLMILTTAFGTNPVVQVRSIRGIY